MSHYATGSAERRRVTVEVLDGREGRWTLAEFISAIEAEIPEEHRAAVVVKIEHDYDRGDSFNIWYERDETDEEVSWRVESDRRWNAQHEERQRREYEILKAKFEK